MLDKAIEHFLFLVNLYGMDPDKAKNLVDKWHKEVYGRKVPQEFNTWFNTNYKGVK